MLYHNFYNLFDYIVKVVNFDAMKLRDFNNFEEIIYLIGKDATKIFKTAINTIDKNYCFKFENVIMSIFNEYLLKKNLSKWPKLIHVALINDRKYFEDLIKYPNKVKFISNIIKWVNESNKIDENLKSDINIINENKNF